MTTTRKSKPPQLISSCSKIAVLMANNNNYSIIIDPNQFKTPSQPQTTTFGSFSYPGSYQPLPTVGTLQPSFRQSSNGPLPCRLRDEHAISLTKSDLNTFFKWQWERLCNEENTGSHIQSLGPDRPGAEALYFYLKAMEVGSSHWANHFLILVGRDLKNISKDPDFLCLDENTLCEILCSDYLDADHEMDVFRAAFRWIRADFDNRINHANQVLSCIRYALMTPRDIVRCVLCSRSLTNLVLDIQPFPLALISGIIANYLADLGMTANYNQFQIRERLTVDNCMPLPDANNSNLRSSGGGGGGSMRDGGGSMGGGSMRDWGSMRGGCGGGGSSGGRGSGNINWSLQNNPSNDSNDNRPIPLGATYTVSNRRRSTPFGRTYTVSGDRRLIPLGTTYTVSTNNARGPAPLGETYTASASVSGPAPLGETYTLSARSESGPGPHDRTSTLSASSDSGLGPLLNTYTVSADSGYGSLPLGETYSVSVSSGNGSAPLGNTYTLPVDSGYGSAQGETYTVRDSSGNGSASLDHVHNASASSGVRSGSLGHVHTASASSSIRSASRAHAHTGSAGSGSAPLGSASRPTGPAVSGAAPLGSPYSRSSGIGSSVTPDSGGHRSIRHGTPIDLPAGSRSRSAAAYASPFHASVSPIRRISVAYAISPRAANAPDQSQSTPDRPVLTRSDLTVHLSTEEK